MRHSCVRALALALSATAIASTSAAAQQPARLLVRVVDSAARLPIPNVEVTAFSRRDLTNARGEVRLVWPIDGTISVRLRQLGFRSVSRSFHRGTSTAASEDTAVVVLARAAFALPEVAVRELRCRMEPDSTRRALSHSTMELLRFGAEQYRTFKETYPFKLGLERRTERLEPGRANPRVERKDELSDSDTWGDPYVPGKVLQSTGNDGWFVPLLMVSALADSAFWTRHCFVARGVESHDGLRMIRLDFSPTFDVRDVEWEGTAYIDSAASVLSRVNFRLTNLRPGGGPGFFEGHTVFSTPSPYIARPDSTVARWSTSGYGSRIPDVTQTLNVRSVTYKKEEPPGGP